jgi:hypothetical protein
MMWFKTGKEIGSTGESTMFYESDDGKFRIESRKRAIPHANGRPGCWMHTSYFLIDSDGVEKEFHSLADAKEAAEAMKHD